MGEWLDRLADLLLPPAPSELQEYVERRGPAAAKGDADLLIREFERQGDLTKRP